MKGLLWCVVLVVLLPIVNAEDNHRPYLHNPVVPEHPKVELYGSYKTNLFVGAGTYSYPLLVPRGTNGLQPVVAIRYNSQAVKQRPGILGAGWTLSENYIVRNINSTTSDVSNDFFTLVLDGSAHDLVRVDDEYRTQRDLFLRIQNFSDAPNNSSTYWVVTSPDGTQYRFGYTSASELVSNTQQNYSVMWSLDLVNDTHGNTITYSYAEDPFTNDTGAVYLTDITYNSDQVRHVEFVYESSVRPDIRRVYSQGNILEQSRRLSSVEIFADGDLVRRYAFGYNSLSSSLSALTNISLHGNDNTTRLHTVSFDYYDTLTGYTDNTAIWIPPAIFSENTSVDFGVRLVDLNHDGYVDLLKGRTTNAILEAWINNKAGNWTLNSTFQPPEYMVDGNSNDYGTRLVDVTGDGFVDSIRSYGTGTLIRSVFKNTGSGWINVSSIWSPSINFYSVGDGDNGVLFADVNDDGKTDMLQGWYAGASAKYAYLNNGAGWTDASAVWAPPIEFIANGTDQGVRLEDINGDGLVDILQANNRSGDTRRAWLNTGGGWEEVSSTWKPPLYFSTDTHSDAGIRLADVNGDGLVDILEAFNSTQRSNYTAWLNTGRGWELNNSWIVAEPFIQAGHNTGRRIADVNGDGIADILVEIGNVTVEYGHTYLKNYNYSYLLKSVTHEYGGVTLLNYTPSTAFDHTGIDGLSKLGFAVNVVNHVRQNNALTGDFAVAGTTNYSYVGGFYDYNATEFRGFRNVTEHMADGSFVRHYFHQDEILQGQEFRTEVYSQNGSLFLRTARNLSTKNRPNEQVMLSSETVSLYDGNTTPRVINTSFAYDSFGNVVERRLHGDSSDLWDDRFEQFTYVYNLDDWIIRPVSQKLLKWDNTTKVQQTFYSYDDGTLTKGDLTRIEHWNNLGNYTVVRRSYDSFGNVLTEIDPLGRVTSYEYGVHDQTHTYPDKMINPLGHMTSFRYDLGTGNMISQTRNDITTQYQYDVHGRILREIKPYDTVTHPTKYFNYSFDGTAPESVFVTVRETGERSTKVLHYYYDGFGRVTQIKSDADGQQVVKNVYYDGLSRMIEEDNPYFASSSEFSLPVSSVNSTQYTYDTLGRVIFVRNPDGSNKTVRFDRGRIVDVDENGHQHEYYLDHFDQIVHVLEYNNDPVAGTTPAPYNTTYDYDAQGNLILISDALGNEFRFMYDSLGRKVAMDDPDLGVWNYSYDAAGNLVEQRDARGNKIVLRYDALNRVVEKNATNVSIHFGYDGQYDGTLSNISAKYGAVTDVYLFSYDERFRVVQEEQTQDNVTFIREIAYDSQDRVVSEEGNQTDLDYFYNQQGRVYKIPGFVTDGDTNAFGSLLNRTYQNGLVTTLSYNSANNRLQQILTGGIQRLDYTYDTGGNILKINDTINIRVQQMSYDYLDRLVNATINGEIYRYEYDPLGRIMKTQENTTVKRYHYRGNQLHAPSRIISRNASVGVSGFSDLTPTSKSKTYEFYLVNELDTAASANWTFGAGNTVVNGTTVVNASGLTRVQVSYNHTTGGEYLVNITSDLDTYLEDISFGLGAKSLNEILRNVSVVVTELKLENTLNSSITGVNWSCEGVTSTLPFNITALNSTIVLIEYNYTSSGDKTFNCTTSSNDGNDTLTTEIVVPGLSYENYALVSSSLNHKIVSYDLTNNFNPLTVGWNISTGEQVLVSNSTSVLNTSKFIIVIQEFNYSDDGDKNISLAAGSAQERVTMNDILALEAVKVEKYETYNANSSTEIIQFDVYNYWPSNLSVNITVPELSITNGSTLAQNQSVMVFIENNYTTAGEKELTVQALSGNFLGRQSDSYHISFLDLLDYQTLYQTQNRSISQLDVRNNLGSMQNMSWVVDTHEGQINATQVTSLNASETVMIIIEANYTEAGVYPSNVSVNSSVDRNMQLGVAIT